MQKSATIRRLALLFSLGATVGATRFAAGATLISGSVTTDVALTRCAFIGYPNFSFDAFAEKTRPSEFTVGTTPFFAYDNGYERVIRDEMWAFVGTYADDGGGSGVVFSVAPDAADSILSAGTTWAELFPDHNEGDLVANLVAIYANPIGSTEYDDAYSWVCGFAKTCLGTWVGGGDVRLLPRYGDEATLIGFSSPTVVGSVTANPVPEPASLSVLGLALLGFLRPRVGRASRK